MNKQLIGRNQTEKPKSARIPRLAIVLRYPIQHFCPMYRSIAADGRVELLVVFGEAGGVARFDNDFGRVVEWQKDILEGYNHTFVATAKGKRSIGVLEELRKFAPDVVYVHGYAIDYLRQAMRWARRNGVPVLMTTDSELRHPRPLHVRAMKRLVLPQILRDVDLFLTVGDENERYFEHYGVCKDRFHRVPFSIDSVYYDQLLLKRIDIRNSIRKKLGISENTVVILTVGKLIPRKGQELLIRAFAEAVKSINHHALLLIVGDGAERTRLEELANPLGSAVRLLGFVNVQELPKYYLSADLYVHPSSFDPHPLAISEALYCSLPVVVSDRVGSAGPTDDVQAGRNGWIYTNGNVAELSAILVKVIDDSSVRERAAEISRELGQLHSADRCGALFVDGALRALASRKMTKL